MAAPSMTIDQARRRFASRDAERGNPVRAEDLRESLGGRYRRLPQQTGWTRRAVWYENDEALLAIVGEQEGPDTDSVLAHGMYHARGRQLRLVLPEAWAYPSRFREPWLKRGLLEISTHSGGEVSQPKRLTKEESRAAAGGFEPRRSYVLGSASEWVRELIEWATSHPHLVEAHTSSLRAWSHNGQRVLVLKGKRRVEIKAGVDAKASPADVYKADGPLDSATMAAVVKRVEQGITHARDTKFGPFEEHHLQVVLRQLPSVLGLEHPVLREVPAWRPAGGGKQLGRGFVDLAATDGAGDVVLVETKLDSDEMLILQGLDYWVWATKPANAGWLRDRLYADAKAPIMLLFAVAGKTGARPKIGRYELATLECLDVEVPWRFALISSWNKREEAPQVDLRGPKELPV